MRERGLKCRQRALFPGSNNVAPVRERGLKLQVRNAAVLSFCRSREGAWIEIVNANAALSNSNSRSREGAWIEILRFLSSAASRFCRSREGAWIEIFFISSLWSARFVAPVRERGLKFPAL